MKLGVIKGENIGYSLSPAIFSKFGQEYFEKPLKEEELEDFFSKKDFDGINVTIPYKEKCVKYLDEISPLSKKIGAVNTVVKKDGKLFGFNTDYYGLKSSILKSNVKVKNRTAVILGGGGAAKAVKVVLEDLGAKVVTVTRKGEINFSNLKENFPHAEIIINATPVGEFSLQDKTLIDPKDFKKLKFYLDLIYRPLETITVIRAKKLKIKAQGGLYHLVAQAKKSAELFGLTDLPDIDKIYKEILFDNRNIVLTGFAGAGKTLVGDFLANKLNRGFIDTDTLIQKKEKDSVNDIIKNKGEKYFRDREKEVIEEISKKHGVIISTGGGAVLDEDNILNLKQNGVLVFIKRDLDEKEIKKRILFSKKQVKAVYKERFSLYNNCCDIKVKNDKTAEITARRIVDKLK